MTDKTKKILIGLAILTGVGLIIYFGYRFYKKNQQKKLVQQALTTTQAIAEAVTQVAASAADEKKVQEQPLDDSNPNLVSAFSGQDPVREKIHNGTWDWSKSNDKFSLKLGSFGPKVKKVQAWINETWDEKVIPETGKFDIHTEEALKGTKGVDFVSSKMYSDLGLK